MDLSTVIRAVPDFPKPGILFRDITPLLNEPAAFRDVPRKQQIFALVVRERLVDPVPQRERQARRDSHGDGCPHRAGHPGCRAPRHPYSRPSKRRAAICSDTRPTRNTITASMMSSTDELVTWDCVAMVHTA